MINQGFVTDSDTEKELKKWQQARTTGQENLPGVSVHTHNPTFKGPYTVGVR